MSHLSQDLRFALRQLGRQPAFTLFAVLTLALGIGANTAIFSVINTVLLKPLPYRDPDRIVMLWTDNPAMNLGIHELPPTPPDLLEWRAQAKSFEQIAGLSDEDLEKIDQALNLKGRVQRDDWVGQARALAGVA